MIDWEVEDSRVTKQSGSLASSLDVLLYVLRPLNALSYETPGTAV